MVEGSRIGVKRTLQELDINHSTFYGWYKRYSKGGYDAQAPKPPIVVSSGMRSRRG